MIDTFEIRCRILELALSGKLSMHDNDDCDVSQMLKDVNHKKDIAVTDHVPYEIPSTWKWVKLSDLYKINPKVEADNDKEAAFIPMERISAGFSRKFSYEIQTWDKASKNHTKFADGDVAFAKISPCFENRKSFIAGQLPNGIGGGTTELIILRQKVMNPLFTYCVVNDKRFIKNGSSSYKGIVGQQRVKSNVIKEYLVPVPPIEEQKRIVAKVDEAFKLLDKIDTLQNKYQNNVDVLKSKIIDAGIRGQLTEQLPEDGTAEELYQAIQMEKAQLIKDKKIKKEKPLPKITADEIPFEIPANWKWVRLRDIVQIINGDRGKNYPAKSTLSHEGIPFISALNLNGDGITEDDRLLCLTDEQYNRLGSGKLERNDIVICIRGSIGKHGRYPYDKGAIASSLVICRPYIYLDEIGCFIMKWLKSYLFVNEIGKYDGGSAQPNLAADNLKKFLVPLPPLSEQKRIVAKINDVFGALDKRDRL